MSQFIKLTNIVINTTKIIKINTYQNKYHICMNNNILDGYLFISFGSIYTTDNIIEICKNKDPLDYQIITKWINSIKPE